MMKASFFVRMKDHVELVKGYKEPFVDYAGRDFFVGVHYHAHKNWRVDCLLTGYMICSGLTRKEAIERFHNQYEDSYNKLLAKQYDDNSFICQKTFELERMQKAYYEHERKKAEHETV